jgi:hypothetical protein
MVNSRHDVDFTGSFRGSPDETNYAGEASAVYELES